MRYRPMPLLILAAFHILEPVFKVLFYSMVFRVPPLRLVQFEIVRGTPFHLFEFFCLFPIAGIAILLFKRWSLILFLIIEVWVLIANMPQLYELLSNGKILYSCFIIGFSLLNILYASYLFGPENRAVYLNPKLRWWEARPRYHAEFSCELENLGKGKITNISKSGLFLESEESLELNRIYKILFKVRDFSFSLDGKVIYHKDKDTGKHAGVQFVNLKRSDKRDLGKMIRVFEKEKIFRRPERREYMKDFKDGVRTIVNYLRRSFFFFLKSKRT